MFATSLKIQDAQIDFLSVARVRGAHLDPFHEVANDVFVQPSPGGISSD